MLISPETYYYTNFNFKNISVFNETGTSVNALVDNEGGKIVIGHENNKYAAVNIGAFNYGGRILINNNKADLPVVYMGVDKEDNGKILVFNKDIEMIGSLP